MLLSPRSPAVATATQLYSLKHLGPKFNRLAEESRQHFDIRCRHDAHAIHALLQRQRAGLQLWNHSATDRRLGNHTADLAEMQPLHYHSIRTLHTRHIRQEDQRI